MNRLIPIYGSKVMIILIKVRGILMLRKWTLSPFSNVILWTYNRPIISPEWFPGFILNPDRLSVLYNMSRLKRNNISRYILIVQHRYIMRKFKNYVSWQTWYLSDDSKTILSQHNSLNGVGFVNLPGYLEVEDALGAARKSITINIFHFVRFRPNLR